MRLPNSAERKLTELDFIRLKKFTAVGTFPQLADSLDDAVAQIEGILFQPEATGDYVT